ncbi:hypothetical protein VTO73DRAFT_11143 [Trametes versicolor]
MALRALRDERLMRPPSPDAVRREADLVEEGGAIVVLEISHRTTAHQNKNTINGVSIKLCFIGGSATVNGDLTPRQATCRVQMRACAGEKTMQKNVEKRTRRERRADTSTGVRGVGNG